MNTLPLDITFHAAQRMRQRGIRESDLDVVLQLAEEIRPDVYFLSHRAAQRAIERLKRRIRKIEKMKGVTAVICDGHIVTTYKTIRSNKRHRRHRTTRTNFKRSKFNP